MSRSRSRAKNPAPAMTSAGPVRVSPAKRPHPRVTRPVRVLEWPRWLSTNYLPRVVDRLRDEGIEVLTPHLLSIGSTRLRAGDWLHVHWSTEAHIHQWRWLYRLRGASFSRQLRLLKKRGVRIAWTAHNLVPHDDPHPDLGRRFRQELLDHADHVFIHFPGAQETLADEFGYRGECSVVHHPHYIHTHPTPPPRDDARATLGLSPDGFVVLSFGKIRPYKGTAEIIKAFQQVARDEDRLLLAGSPEGDVSTELEIATEDHRIVLHARRIPDDEVPTYFAAADAAVVAHHAFFTSGSALMALSMGCPLVGPAIYHLADLAGEDRLYPAGPGLDGLAAALVEAREKAPAVDREAVRAWTAGQGTWSDAAIGLAAVFKNSRPPSR